MNLLEIARYYVGLGLSVIPIKPDGSKAPAVDTWKKFQKQIATDDDLKMWFSEDGLGIAILCGAISGHLEVLDFDDPQIYTRWSQLPELVADPRWQLLPRVRTPSQGVHVYGRLSKAGKCRKLAKTETGKTLIEIKAEGGYVLAPGCPLLCHPSNGEYVWENYPTAANFQI